MNDRDLELLAEMKYNCTKQEHYVDSNAMDKYMLLRKLEFMANSYMLYLATEIEITQSKINRCTDESAKVTLMNHLDTVKSIRRKLEAGDI
jgi:hypothetical protein|nr:MAG TPA: hypothetical protein [Caudoviricetes sp.]